MKHYPNVPHRRDILIVRHLTFWSSLPSQDCCHTFENFLPDTHASLYPKPTSPISILRTQQHNQRLRCRFNRNEFVHHHTYIHSFRKAVCHQPNYIFTYIFTYFSIFHHNKSGNNFIFLLFKRLPDLLWSFPFFLYKIGLSQTKTYKR